MTSKAHRIIPAHTSIPWIRTPTNASLLLPTESSNPRLPESEHPHTLLFSFPLTPLLPESEHPHTRFLSFPLPLPSLNQNTHTPFSSPSHWPPCSLNQNTHTPVSYPSHYRSPPWIRTPTHPSLLLPTDPPAPWIRTPTHPFLILPTTAPLPESEHPHTLLFSFPLTPLLPESEHPHTRFLSFPLPLPSLNQNTHTPFSSPSHYPPWIRTPTHTSPLLPTTLPESEHPHTLLSFPLNPPLPLPWIRTPTYPYPFLPTEPTHTPSLNLNTHTPSSSHCTHPPPPQSEHPHTLLLSFPLNPPPPQIRTPTHPSPLLPTDPSPSWMRTPTHPSLLSNDPPRPLCLQQQHPPWWVGSEWGCSSPPPGPAAEHGAAHGSWSPAPSTEGWRPSACWNCNMSTLCSAPATYSSSSLKKRVKLIPSLPQPVKFLGWKVLKHAYKDSIFWSYYSSIFNTVHLLKQIQILSYAKRKRVKDLKFCTFLVVFKWQCGS